jgi:hypothetical protein
LLVSVLFGLLPAVRFSRPNLVPALKDDAGGGGVRRFVCTGSRRWCRSASPFRFSSCSGVLLDRVRTAEFGFPTDGLRPRDCRCRPRPSGRPLLDPEVRDHLQQASGVRSVAVAEGTPIDFDSRPFRVARVNGAEFVTAHVTRVSENFSETIGVPMLRGRTITAEDRLMTARSR